MTKCATQRSTGGGRVYGAHRTIKCRSGRGKLGKLPCKGLVFCVTRDTNNNASKCSKNQTAKATGPEVDGQIGDRRCQQGRDREREIEPRYSHDRCQRYGVWCKWCRQWQTANAAATTPLDLYGSYATESAGRRAGRQ